MANNASALLLRVELLERRLSGDGPAEQHIHGASDTFWLLFCGALVNFMQVGFAMLETGSVRLCDESGCVDAFEGTIEVIFDQLNRCHSLPLVP